MAGAPDCSRKARKFLYKCASDLQLATGATATDVDREYPALRDAAAAPAAPAVRKDEDEQVRKLRSLRQFLAGKPITDLAEFAHRNDIPLSDDWSVPRVTAAILDWAARRMRASGGSPAAPITAAAPAKRPEITSAEKLRALRRRLDAMKPADLAVHAQRLGFKLPKHLSQKELVAAILEHSVKQLADKVEVEDSEGDDDDEDEVVINPSMNFNFGRKAGSAESSKEAAKVPKKEAPVMEAPVKKAPVKEAPVKEAPVKEVAKGKGKEGAPRVSRKIEESTDSRGFVEELFGGLSEGEVGKFFSQIGVASGGRSKRQLLAELERNLDAEPDEEDDGDRAGGNGAADPDADVAQAVSRDGIQTISFDQRGIVSTAAKSCAPPSKRARAAPAAPAAAPAVAPPAAGAAPSSSAPHPEDRRPLFSVRRAAGGPSNVYSAAPAPAAEPKSKRRVSWGSNSRKMFRKTDLVGSSVQHNPSRKPSTGILKARSSLPGTIVVPAPHSSRPADHRHRS